MEHNQRMPLVSYSPRRMASTPNFLSFTAEEVSKTQLVFGSDIPILRHSVTRWLSRTTVARPCWPTCLLWPWRKSKTWKIYLTPLPAGISWRRGSDGIAASTLDTFPSRCFCWNVFSTIFCLKALVRISCMTLSFTTPQCKHRTSELGQTRQSTWEHVPCPRMCLKSGTRASTCIYTTCMYTSWNNRGLHKIYKLAVDQ